MRVGVDVGGTFTDLVALGADGTLEVRKVTTTPDDPTVGMFRAVDLLGTREARKRSEEHTSELQSQSNLVCRLLLEKKKKKNQHKDHKLNRNQSTTMREYTRATAPA